ncbi:hypothetical protein [Metabacillus endolithicus]|uniref:Uncharacterized protein n=1 Tax=Metabacillus endolithicus TaxID=1535204 RepID=A0ABW5C255_9BACI|nr:hypothetical protein [Metabacillus endolithicus]UPG66248.1 hypothetical protein MVE64_26440 [Metabacillus endolithicus]
MLLNDFNKLFVFLRETTFLKYFVLIIIVLSFTVGFKPTTDDSDIINSIKPTKEDQYVLMSFFNSTPEQSINESTFLAQNEIDSILKRHQVSYYRSVTDSNLGKELNIDKSPTFMVISYEGIVLRTNNIKDVGKYFKPVPKIE